MREIKFRAWDKEEKKWIGRKGTTFNSENPSEGVVALTLTGHLRVFSASLMRGEKEEDDLLSVAHSEYESVHPCNTKPSYKIQYILCQYTGLKDKNGKEIYEGDILSYELKQGWEIFFEDGCYYMMHDGHSYLLEKIRGQISEIIGNIYENPELMKEAK